MRITLRLASCPIWGRHFPKADKCTVGYARWILAFEEKGEACQNSGVRYKLVILIGGAEFYFYLPLGLISP